MFDTNDETFLHSFIMRELTIPLSEWPRVLAVLGVPHPTNFDCDYDICEELIRIFQRGQLRAARIPRLASLPAFHEKKEEGYCFTRGPDHYPIRQAPKPISSIAEATALLQSLNITERTLSRAWHGNPPLAQMMDWKYDALTLFTEGLASGDILAYRVEAHPPASPVKAVEFVAATSVDREVPPPRPDTKGIATATPEKSKAECPPPQTLEECGQRLEVARERLITTGYQSKYTDAQVRALAQKGELDDRFVVRLIETQYAGDAGYLGRKTGGEVKYWSTTFNQMENADTDPATLCALIGVAYIPGNSYTLVIVDTQAPGAGQAVTIVPTHKNLGEFAMHEIKDIDPRVVDSVMTPEYNDKYAQHMAAFNKRGLSIDKEKDIQRYADENLSSDAEKKCFETRARIHQRLGANEHYTGDGTTQNLIKDCANECGVMETFTYDKSPQTLGQLEANGSAKRIAMKPI